MIFSSYALLVVKDLLHNKGHGSEALAGLANSGRKRPIRFISVAFRGALKHQTVEGLYDVLASRRKRLDEA